MKEQPKPQLPARLAELRNPGSELDPTEFPLIDSRLTALKLTKSVRDNIPQDALYRIGENYIYIIVGQRVNAAGARENICVTLPVNPSRFLTWVEQYVGFFRKTGEDAIPCSLSINQCEYILNSLYFRSATPEIRELSTVRLPVNKRADDGKRVAELAEPGYDHRTGIYTVSTVGVPSWPEQSKDQLYQAWKKLFGEFPFDDVDVPFEKSRSASAAVAVTMGLFCRNLILRMPVCVINAKKRGTGKTLMGKLILAGLYGTANIMPKPTTDDELRKTLSAAVAASRQYAYLDDLRTLSSPAINQYATADMVDSRVLGRTEMKETATRLFILATGNSIATSPDIERRTLFVDLQYPGDVKDRKFSGRVNDMLFGDTEYRKSLLGLYWATYRAWVADGAPVLCPGNSLPSFESFCEVAGSIAMWLGLPNPFAKRVEWANSGDVRGHEAEYLIQYIASVCMPSTPDKPHHGLVVKFTVQDLMKIADEELHTRDIIAEEGPNQSKSFGRAMGEHWGSEFKDCHGRKFYFGKKKGRRTTVYNFEFEGEPDTYGQLPLAWAQEAAKRAGVDWSQVTDYKNRSVVWRYPGGNCFDARTDDDDDAGSI